MCQVCKTCNHPLIALRRRLADDLFERLLDLRDGTKTAGAASAALEAALIGASIDAD